MSLINPAIVLLSPKMREIARRLISGESQADIARSMGLSSHAVSVIVNRNPLFKRAMSEMQCRADDATFDLMATMRVNSKEAAETIVAAMRDESAPLHVRARAADKVLGYAGYRNASTPQVNIQNNSNNLTFEQRLALELPADTPAEIIDTDPLKELEDVRDTVREEVSTNTG